MNESMPEPKSAAEAARKAAAEAGIQLPPDRSGHDHDVVPRELPAELQAGIPDGHIVNQGDFEQTDTEASTDPGQPDQ